MEHKTERGAGIQTTRTVFDIVETICDRSQVGLEEIAAAADVANSTAYDHLVSLEEAGYVIHDEGGYRLSLKFLDHGVVAQHYYDDLVETAEPVIDQLVQETKETINLVVEEQGRSVYVHRRTGERGIPTNSWPGKAKPIHTLAAGKAILAHMPTEAVEAILATHGLERVTENSLTTREALDEELETVREQGYAVNDMESDHGIRAVGAPIVTDGEVQGAVSIAGPANRLKGSYFTSELPDMLLGTVNEIELKLAYQS